MVIIKTSEVMVDVNVSLGCSRELKYSPDDLAATAQPPLVAVDWMLEISCQFYV